MPVTNAYQDFCWVTGCDINPHPSNLAKTFNMETENSLKAHDHDSETYEESIFQLVWCKYFSNFGYE